MIDTPQHMTYEERENLKLFAAIATSNGDTKALSDALTMIAHWHRQPVQIEFTNYASNWVAARLDLSATMRETWPFHGKRQIKDCCSDWNSYGR